MRRDAEQDYCVELVTDNGITVTTKPDLTVSTWGDKIRVERAGQDGITFNSLSELAQVFVIAERELKNQKTARIAYCQQQLKQAQKL